MLTLGNLLFTTLSATSQAFLSSPKAKPKHLQGPRLLALASLFMGHHSSHKGFTISPVPTLPALFGVTTSQAV